MSPSQKIRRAPYALHPAPFFLITEMRFFPVYKLCAVFQVLLEALHTFFDIFHGIGIGKP